MLAYLDPNIHGTLKPRRGRILSLPVETFARVTIRHKKSSSTTLSVTIISFGLPPAYGERMVKGNKPLCARYGQAFPPSFSLSSSSIPTDNMLIQTYLALKRIGARFFLSQKCQTFLSKIEVSEVVTLIHVTNEAFESFWKMHAQFLWQEM
jgi:hypothetical protein